MTKSITITSEDQEATEGMFSYRKLVHDRLAAAGFKVSPMRTIDWAFDIMEDYTTYTDVRGVIHISA